MIQEPVLRVKNLTTPIVIEKKIYNVVDDLSFDLHPGKTLALVGESGSGKSMTAHSILRILPSPPVLPPKGLVSYKGINLLTLSEKQMRRIRGSKIGMIFQDPMNALNPVYTIGYQLYEVVRFHLGFTGKQAERKILDALKDVHIPEPEIRIYNYPHQLSGGQLQRIMIAMALLCSPDILIADEPTTALDVTIQKQILNLITELKMRTGMAVLLITHDMGVVEKVADDVIVMYATEKVEETNKYALFQKPLHPYTQGLFKSRPSHPIKEEKFYTIKGTIPPLTALPIGCHFSTRCPFVMDVCKQEVPLFSPEENRQVKCWLYSPDRNPS